MKEEKQNLVIFEEDELLISVWRDYFSNASIIGIDIDKEAISLIVRSADGSIRDGLSLLDQVVANQNEKIDVNMVSKMLGLAEREKIFDLLENILQVNKSLAVDDNAWLKVIVFAVLDLIIKV